MKQQRKFKVNNLEVRAREWQGRMMDAETLKEIMAEDITDLFMLELEEMLKRKELVNIPILGRQTLGKSTLAMDLMKKSNTMLELENPLEMDYICSDQIDFNRKVKKPDMHDKTIMIDEYNTLGETDFNATTEKAFMTAYIDMCAQRNVRRFYCSPTRIFDPTAPLILEVVTKEVSEEETTTGVIAYWKLNTPMSEQIIPIGRIAINVGQTIRHPIFKRYRQLKERRMELISQGQIRDSRELELAGLELDTYNELKDLTKIIKLNTSKVKQTMKRVTRTKGLHLSIMGTLDSVDNVTSLLDMEREIYKLQESISKNKASELYNPTEYNKNQAIAKKAILKKMIQEQGKSIEELKNKVKIRKEFDEI